MLPLQQLLIQQLKLTTENNKLKITFKISKGLNARSILFYTLA